MSKLETIAKREITMSEKNMIPETASFEFLVIRVCFGFRNSNFDRSLQSTEQKFRICLGRVEVVDQFFHRLNRRQRSHLFAQLLHSLPFVRVIKQILASGCR